MTDVDQRVAVEGTRPRTYSEAARIHADVAGSRGLLGSTARSVGHGAPVPTPAIVAAVAYVACMPLLRPVGPFNTGPVDLAGSVLVLAVGLRWLTGRTRMELPFALPIAIFALAGTLGALAGPAAGNGLTAVLQDAVLLVVCGCLAAIGRTVAIQRLLVRTWAISGVCWACVLIAGVLTHATALSGGGTRYGVRATLTMGDPNMAGNYFVTSLFMLYVARWPARRGPRASASLVIVVAVFLTGSNGAVVAIGAGAAVAGVVAVCARARWPAWLGLITLAAAVGLVFGAAPVGQWQHDVVTNAQASSIPIVRDSFGRVDQSSSTRRTLLDESLQLFRADGVFGTGPGSTKALLEAKQFPYQKEAHDDYLAALTERGALGVLGLAFLVGVVVRRLAALTRVRGRPADPGVVAPAAMIGCATALAASGMFYEVLHFRDVWVFLAILACTSAGRRP